MAGTADFIWMNGNIIEWNKAQIHVTSEAVLRGASVFEGLRGYLDTAGEISLFRVPEHLTRLRQSAKVMRLPIIYSDEKLTLAMRELVKANRFDQNVHLRLTAYFGEGAGYSWLPDEIESGVFIFALPSPRRPGASFGIKSGVSTWRRNADNAAPSRVKASANYHNSRLAQVEARHRGQEIPIMLNQHGNVAESPSSCFFMLRDGRLVTPSVTEDILESITRDTIIQLAREFLNLEVIERPINRSELYICDEAFLCGSGHEILPITSIDDYPVGNERPGEVTTRIQQIYDDCVSGRLSQHSTWLTPTAELESAC